MVTGATSAPALNRYYAMTTKARTPKAAKKAVELTNEAALENAAHVLVAKPDEQEAPKSEEALDAMDSPDTVRPATGSATRAYLLAKEARDAITLQRPGKGLGQQWRSAGYKAPSVRHAALSALADAATPTEDGGLLVTYEAAYRAFKTLADEGRLGCSTPAGRIAKFVRSGHLIAC